MFSDTGILGLDTIPIIVPLREFGKEFSRSLSNLPQLPPLQSAPRKRMILAWWNREVSIWHVYSRRRIHDENGDTEGAEHKSRKLIAKIAFQVSLAIFRHIPLTDCQNC